MELPKPAHGPNDRFGSSPDVVNTFGLGLLHLSNPTLALRVEISGAPKVEVGQSLD
jgi:hypothetical protein